MGFLKFDPDFCPKNFNENAFKFLSIGHSQACLGKLFLSFITMYFILWISYKISFQSQIGANRWKFLVGSLYFRSTKFFQQSRSISYECCRGKIFFADNAFFLNVTNTDNLSQLSLSSSWKRLIIMSMSAKFKGAYKTQNWVFCLMKMVSFQMIIQDRVWRTRLFKTLDGRWFNFGLMFVFGHLWYRLCHWNKGT